MKIIAELTEKGVSITGAIVIPELKIPLKTLSFIVDTGADLTTLTEVEAEIIGIDFRNLERSPRSAISLGGTVESYVLKDILFIFTTDQGGKEFSMSSIQVSKYPRRSGERGKKDKFRFKAIPNLLGRDFLTEYEIKLFADFKENKAYLEY